MRLPCFQPHRYQHDLEERPVDVGDHHHLQGIVPLQLPSGTTKNFEGEHKKKALET